MPETVWEILHERLRRAHRHLEELHTEIESVELQLDNYSVLHERDPKSGHHIRRMKVHRLPPVAIAIIGADCVNNLRSTLDNLMWELVRLHRPGRRDEQMKFPVFASEAAWSTFKEDRLAGVPGEIVERLEMNQPYRAEHHGAGHREHKLWLLNRLWNDQKHRGIEHLRWVVEDAKIGPDRAVDEARWFPRADDGAILADIFPITGTAYEDDIYADFLFGVGFGPQVFDGASLERSLGDIHRTLSEQTLPLFEPYLV